MNAASDLCSTSATLPLSAVLRSLDKNPDELIRLPQRRKQNSNSASVVWSHFQVHRLHASKEKNCAVYANKIWCDYCRRLYVREHSTLLRHLQRHHKEQLSKPCGQRDSPFALACNEKQNTLKAKRVQLEQYFTTKDPL